MAEDPRAAIASIIADYRQGQVPKPDAAHVDRWAGQFPAGVREPMLHEMAHILARSYVTRQQVIGFLTKVASSRKLVGDDPAAFWRGVRFLRLQTVGNSQRDLLALFDTVLQQSYGFTTADCGAKPTMYVYLDDGIFSGGRTKSDLIGWIERDAPKAAKVAVIVMALHRYGQYSARTAVEKAATAAGKSIDIGWWGLTAYEDRRAYTDESDVLRPKAIPAEAAAYMATLEYRPVLRTGDAVGKLGLFSSGAARHMIEQAFLAGGVEVRRRCRHLGEQMRPLGSTWLQTPGFGTLFVTYRNIANNTPLVLWAGDPWYPLFPRRTN